MADAIDEFVMKLSLNCEKSSDALEELLKRFKLKSNPKNLCDEEWQLRYNDNYRRSLF